MNLRKFFIELKRCNVYNVAVAYAVVAWLLIQGASIFFPTFGAPSWVMKVFITIVVWGFPAALRGRSFQQNARVIGIWIAQHLFDFSYSALA